MTEIGPPTSPKAASSPEAAVMPEPPVSAAAPETPASAAAPAPPASAAASAPPVAPVIAQAEAPGSRRVAHVLLDTALPQLDHLFDYSLPEALAGEARVGHRVRVPFRSQGRQSFGYLIGFAEHSEFAGDLQPVSELVGPVPQLTPEVWRLARAVADRAGGSAGDILRLAIPQRMVRVEKQFLAAAADADADAAAAPAAARAETPADTPATSGPSDPATSGHSDPGAGTATQDASETADLLVAGERVTITPAHGPVRIGTGEWVGGWAVRLARIALAVHATGRSVILAVPDYRDLDQLRDTLVAFGHEDAVRVDARQSNAERYAGFLRALEPVPRIVLGNRSAVYAPAHNLGALVLWDDGDPLLSEPLTPYVHARDAALIRAEQSGAGLCFAAHARSTEVQRLVDLGYVRAERWPPLRTRVLHADASVTPDVFAGRVPEFAAREIRAGLRQGPVLVQVAAPGYAPAAVCADCGDRARCTEADGRCAGPIGFRAAGRAACRWCGTPATRWRCASCGGRHLEQRGMGSQRTVEQFERQFSGSRVILSDGEHPHERVDSRPALVVATRGAEPIAAGGYRTVVLLDAERLLSIESLRAGEDCLRWWLNAAALAAPDARVILASGGGPVVRAFLRGRVEEWLSAEVRDRHALRYPPAVRVASVTGGPDEVGRALGTLADLAGIDVLGPAPVPADAARGGAAEAARTSVPLVRAIVRFEYAQGAAVAKRLRGALVADAAGASSRVSGRKPGRARPGALRLRFDDRGVFDA